MLCRVFYILGSIFHCIAVSAVFQHFYIISPVSEGRAFLRRNAPSFRKPPDTGRFMAAWHDQINRTMSAGCRFDLAIQSSAEQIAVKTGFFFLFVWIICVHIYLFHALSMVSPRLWGCSGKILIFFQSTKHFICLNFIIILAVCQESF